MGPGTKFPTLGQISYDDLSASYEELAYGLLEGGVDLLSDRDDVRLAVGKGRDRRLPSRHGASRTDRAHPSQVTIELTGRMLPGTEIGAAIAALSPLGIDVLGLNCATGPVEMYEPLRATQRQCATAPLLHAQRRTAERGRRKDALRPHARRAGRTPFKVRD
jgi:5-methyltetrahydrofolate--homocysteine methyltransferase